MLGRDAALEIRMATERGRRLDRAFAAVASDLEPRDRSFVHELVYGTTRLRGRLDHLIDHHVHRGMASLDSPVLEILRLGAYQLLYMDGVPEYAAVSESVGQARSAAGQGAAGLVNAVLRKVGHAGDGPERFPAAGSDFAGFLASWGSHPLWLIERWLGRWSRTEVRALVESNNERPELYLYALEIEPEEAVGVLAAAGIGAEVVGAGSGCVRLERGSSPAAALEAIPEAVVQDPGANLVALYSDVPTGTRVADLCAAPGGKALSASLRSTYTLASDRSESRMRMVRENALRAGRDLGLAVADARHPPVSAVDVVLLDVPCSGTGTLSRHPDARWRLTPDSMEELAALQADMLAGAADAVRPGGLMVYSTCTLESEENEGVVLAFLARHQDFLVEATESVPDRYLDERGFLFITPQSTGFDGAFAARLRRAA